MLSQELEQLLAALVHEIETIVKKLRRPLVAGTDVTTENVSCRAHPAIYW